MMISKRLRNLKDDSRQGGVPFDVIADRLHREGIANSRGRCTYFNDARGFGFLIVNGRKLFMHISAVKGGERPAVGDVFDVEVSGDNKVTRATRINGKAT